MGKVLLESHRHPKYPRLTLDLRTDSRFYQARTFIDGRQRGKSTGVTELSSAFKLAAEWYQKLLRASASEGFRHPVKWGIGAHPTMGEVLRDYLTEIDVRRRPDALMRWGPIQHFWRPIVVSEIDTQTFKAFYRWRRQRGAITPNTLHKDVVLVRQLLKHAMLQGYVTGIPPIPDVGTIRNNPRPWLTPNEWRHLCAVSEQRLRAAKHNPRLLRQRQDLDDFMRFMVASMCRVDESLTLRFSNCRFEHSDGQDVLIAQVIGKRGTRTIVAIEQATIIVLDRRTRVEGDQVFPEHHRDAFRELLKAADLYTDAVGFTRNFKSLRATAISFRLLEPNANLLLIARNAGTSLAMIDQFYAKRLSAEMHLDELSKPLARSAAFETEYFPQRWRKKD